MAIQWTGLFANVGYSSANNKTQDDAVTGMQDTLYVTGPGYGAYEAVVRLYNSTGALVASVNVSGGGGALSAPPPVRFVDNGTVYSYSLEVVRGYIPTEDADGIVIRLVGGASKRFPSPMSVTPSGDVQFGGAVIGDSFVKSDGSPVGGGVRTGNVTLAIGNSIGENAYGLQNPGGTGWGQAATSPALNSYAIPSITDRRMDHRIRAKCTTAGGARGTVEPIWPAVGETVADGAVVWTMERATSGSSPLSGYVSTANALAGQPLDIQVTVGCPGSRSDFVIAQARRALELIDPDKVLISDLWGNDINQLGTIPQCAVAWDNVESFMDEQIAAGRQVIFQPPAPSSSYNTVAKKGCASFLHAKSTEWARANAPQATYWTYCYDSVLSETVNSAHFPSTAEDFLSLTGTGLAVKLTDGIHHNNVCIWRLAKDYKTNVIDKLGCAPYAFSDVGDNQKWDNPKNLGSNASGVAGITGFFPNGWTAYHSSDASAVASIIPRTDGIRGNWFELNCTGTLGNSKSVGGQRDQSLASLGLAVGDEIEVLAEIWSLDLSNTVTRPRVDVGFLSGVEYSVSSSMFWGGDTQQYFGQAMASDNLVQVIRPIGFRAKIPTGTTAISIICALNGDGAWTGKIRIGRININKIVR